MILIPLRVIKTTSNPFVWLQLVKKVAIVDLLQIHFMAKMATSITFPSFYRKLEDVDAAPCSR